MKQFLRTLFIFRRDLRIQDNCGLNWALKNSQEVIPCFIFTPTQIENNPYRGSACLQFMLESLEDLERAIASKNGRLFLFYGEPQDIVQKCAKELNIDSVACNKDYTPYSLSRDQKLFEACQNLNISFASFDDALLHIPKETLKKNGTPYTVFTPFYKNALHLPVNAAESYFDGSFYQQTISFAETTAIYEKILPQRVFKASGGRANCLKILKQVDEFSDYSTVRNFPFEDKTTHLSPHLKFTTCSIREIYWSIVKQFGKEAELIRALYWRDFFTLIAYHFPEVFTGAFRKQWRNISWVDDPELFIKWSEGKTGFPIVDAGMRQLNQTGFLHGRLRMIVASFLTKDLHIDWRLGERYFANTLVDYDPAVNNGNWQWVAGTGCDAQPYFRIFNPWTQGEKFDPLALYIKKWVPELSCFDPKTIHQWYIRDNHSDFPDYPVPIVDHAEASKKVVELFFKK